MIYLHIKFHLDEISSSWATETAHLTNILTLWPRQRSKVTNSGTYGLEVNSDYNHIMFEKCRYSNERVKAKVKLVDAVGWMNTDVYILTFFMRVKNQKLIPLFVVVACFFVFCVSVYSIKKISTRSSKAGRRLWHKQHSIEATCKKSVRIPFDSQLISTIHSQEFIYPLI